MRSWKKRTKLGDATPDSDFSKATLLQPPIPILRQSNWPLLEVEKGFFDAMDGEEEDEELEEKDEEGADVTGWGDDDGLDLDLGEDEKPEGDDDQEAGGWGDDLDLDLGSDVDDDDDGDDDFKAQQGVVVPSRGKTAE